MRKKTRDDETLVHIGTTKRQKVTDTTTTKPWPEAFIDEPLFISFCGYLPV